MSDADQRGEFQITEAMIKAGANEIRLFDPSMLGDAEATAVEVFMAMIKHSDCSKQLVQHRARLNLTSLKDSPC